MKNKYNFLKVMVDVWDSLLQTIIFVESQSSSHQGLVLYVLPQQAVVIEGVLGLAGHSVHWSFIHLVLYGPEKHVK